MVMAHASLPAGRSVNTGDAGGVNVDDEPASTVPGPGWDEADRLASLHGYAILDTPAEADFDDITCIAAHVCGAPISTITLIDADRQWFKSEIGLGVRETPLDVSICAHAILQRDLFVVPDTTQDPRFACYPSVTGEPHLRFYAGALLEDGDGLPLGTLCVLDYQPREAGLTPEQAAILRALARQVMAQLELRRLLRRSQADQAALQQALEAQRLLHVEADHRIKNSLQLVSGMLALQRRRLADPAAAAALDAAISRVQAVADAHRALNGSPDLRTILLGAMLDDLCRHAAALNPHLAFSREGGDTIALDAERAIPLGLICSEVLTNISKYAYPDGQDGSVHVQVEQAADRGLTITVKDHGLGLGSDANSPDGLGTTIVAALARQIGANVSLAGGADGGTTTIVRLPAGPSPRE